MTTTDLIKRKINTCQDLHSVVKTMKALAAVSLRQYEKAVESLVDYTRTVEMGLQVVLKNQIPTKVNQKNNQETILIIFGSDQGMCGQFNDQIVHHTLEEIKDLNIQLEDLIIITIGSRLIAPLAIEKIKINQQFFNPASVIGITPLVQELLIKIDQLQTTKLINYLLLAYNQPYQNNYQPMIKQLLPLDQKWLKQLEKTRWKTKMIPLFTLPAEILFSALIRQYLFISLYQACAGSLASENSSRLSAMQIAQKNIEDRLEELNREYQQIRQTDINNELLDLVSGFEALTIDN